MQLSHAYRLHGSRTIELHNHKNAQFQSLEPMRMNMSPVWVEWSKHLTSMAEDRCSCLTALLRAYMCAVVWWCLVELTTDPE